MNTLLWTTILRWQWQKAPRDVATHPLMGNVFENMVVADAFKTRFNAGRRPDLYFYRNSSGSIEIDLLRDDGTDLYACEIKAASAFHEKMISGRRKFSGIAPNVKRSTVIYSGKTMLPLAANYADIGLVMSN